ncbi:MAG: hypothetical protein CL790_05015 [Chloroflexi bacterium]|nr:hypothetical protein [Chloroflexota bacterium]HCU73033.1 hypothetical protein [Chloroflexota bacterium]|tara:strand:+ start:1124 stop:1666 length:543 start_codon:yes stop_codon:yes gene_type:complete
MIRAMINSRRLVGVAVGLLCALATVACGETDPVQESPVVATSAPVAKATVPPGRTAAPAAAVPTARTSQTVAAVVQVTAAPTEASTPAPTAASTAAPVAVAVVKGGSGNGKELFTANGCIACHGADLSGGIGPKLAGRSTADLTDDRIRSQVRNGGNGMPAFEKITDQQLADIIAFIRSV